MNKTSLWFSLFTNKDYISNDAPYVDISAIHGVKNLENNYKTILEELEIYLSTHEMQGHFNTMMVEKPQSWKVRSLRVWGVEMYDIQKHFKKTIALIDQIPGVINVGFNLLEAGAKIKPHCGDTNAIERCHLGLKIPANAPTCALKVKDEIKGWENGRAISFIDAYQHEAWNLSSENRIILLFDILKPEFRSQKNKICATILSSLYIQNIGNMFPKMYTFKREKFKYILKPFIWFLQVAIPLRNKLKKN